MIEPNIVYIGDKVLVENFGQAWVAWGDENGGDFGMADDSTYHEWPYVTTPDGRPVEGFGGAKIEFDGSSECFMIGGVELSQLDAPETGYAADDYERDAAFQRALSCAVRLCADLYGEWVREPTEQDLKRRGLM